MDKNLERLLGNSRLDGEAAQAVRAARAAGLSLDEALFRASGLEEGEVLKMLSDFFGIPCVSVEDETPGHDFLAAFPARVLLRHGLLPLSEENGVVTTATSRLSDTSGFEELRLSTGLEFRPVLAGKAEIGRALRNSLGVGADTVQSLVAVNEDEKLTVLAEETPEDSVDITAGAEDASIIRFVNQVLKEAIEMRATDVHFEPFEKELRVRYRVDGILQNALVPADIRRFQGAIVSRLKILSSLDIAEKRLPQDGRIKLLVAGRETDVRVSVIPMLHGEAVVLRLLDRGAAILGLSRLGMSEEDRLVFREILDLPHGIILVTGPTGSGKTTTLYAGLSQINDMSRKIVTIEDPIEYHLHGINQIQVSGRSGLTFARGLRSVLRHDPDVILVGEIRDYETAEISVQASLTGHLVFSTLHTNDAPGALTRLVDMGVEPYLVSSSLEAVIAQRLVRLICPSCREKIPAEEAALLSGKYGAGFENLELTRGQGCRECLGTGYRGRTGVFEFMRLDEEIRSLIMEKASSGIIREKATSAGMKGLREDGWRLVRDGLTTVEEVLRITRDEPVNGASPLNGDRASIPAPWPRKQQGRKNAVHLPGADD